MTAGGTASHCKTSAARSTEVESVVRAQMCLLRSAYDFTGRVDLATRGECRWPSGSPLLLQHRHKQYTSATMFPNIEPRSIRRPPTVRNPCELLPQRILQMDDQNTNEGRLALMSFYPVRARVYSVLLTIQLWTGSFASHTPADLLLRLHWLFATSEV